MALRKEFDEAYDSGKMPLHFSVEKWQKWLCYYANRAQDPKELSDPSRDPMWLSDEQAQEVQSLQNELLAEKQAKLEKFEQ